MCVCVCVCVVCGGRHSFLCHVDVDKAVAAATAADVAAATAADGAAHEVQARAPKSSRKRDRRQGGDAQAETDGEALERGGGAGGAGAGNFYMVDKYGPLLCAEFLTANNLLLVERSASLAAFARAGGCCLLLHQRTHHHPLRCILITPLVPSPLPVVRGPASRGATAARANSCSF